MFMEQNSPGSESKSDDVPKTSSQAKQPASFLKGFRSKNMSFKSVSRLVTNAAVAVLFAVGASSLAVAGGHKKAGPGDIVDSRWCRFVQHFGCSSAGRRSGWRAER